MAAAERRAKDVEGSLQGELADAAAAVERLQLRIREAEEGVQGAEDAVKVWARGGGTCWRPVSPGCDEWGLPQVKAAMVDSANEANAALKASLAAAQQEVAACRGRLGRAESELRRRDDAEAERLQELQYVPNGSALPGARSHAQASVP